MSAPPAPQGSPASGGGPRGGNFFTRKLGPLPVYGWFGIAFGGGYVLLKWRARKAGAATTSTPTASATPTYPDYSGLGSAIGGGYGGGPGGGGGFYTMTPTPAPAPSNVPQLQPVTPVTPALAGPAPVALPSSMPAPLAQPAGFAMPANPPAFVGTPVPTGYDPNTLLSALRQLNPQYVPPQANGTQMGPAGGQPVLGMAGDHPFVYG
jgi:hypothetical protein